MTLPGQQPTAPQPTAGTAIVPAPASMPQPKIVTIAGRGEVERFETEVTIPADFQYAIPIRGKRNPDGTWDNNAAKIGLTADGYEYLNRVLGVSFFLPDMVHDAEGKMSPNPIHRKDYIYLRLGAVWYNPMGQLCLATEDVEVDFNLTWMDARINSKSAEVVLDENTGLPAFDAFGNPAVKLSKDDELKALKTLSQLRTFGPRYAQTVARVRLLKMASGIRSLPLPAPKTIMIRVTGYRDHMEPQKRIEAAGGALTSLYGRPPEVKPLSQAEMVEVAPDVDPDTEVIDRDAVAARVNHVETDEEELDRAAEAAKPANS